MIARAWRFEQNIHSISKWKLLPEYFRTVVFSA